ncbi:MAG: hypothetical protein ACI8RZ_003262, partial [Myxococcota bacterium]
MFTPLLLATLTLLSPLRAAEPTRGLTPVGEASAQQRVYGRRVALVVGINDFAEEGLSLRYAVPDAQSIAAVLEEQYGFEVIALYNSDASQESIRAVLEELTSLGKEDGLLVFWAGHGTTMTDNAGNEMGYLLPWDGTMSTENAAQNISMAELRRLLGERIEARHRLLIVDACYSGLLSVRSATTLPPHDLAYVQNQLHRTTFQVLTAGQSDQTVLDGGLSGHSVFAGRLLEQLRQVEDFVTATELGVSVTRQVSQDAYDRGHQQTPTFNRIIGDGDFLLIPSNTVLDFSTLPEHRLTPRGQRRAVASGTSLAIGAVGLLAAGLSASSYRNAPLNEGSQPGLMA